MDAFIAGAWRTPRRGEVLIGGAWRTITRGEQYRSGAWKRIVAFTSPLSLYCDNAFATIRNRKPASATTNPVAATPTGGLAPYSYLWAKLDGVADALAPTNAVTAFRAVAAPGTSTDTLYRVTCTDALGTIANTVITVVITNEGEF